jgi:hypothetical protein
VAALRSALERSPARAAIRAALRRLTRDLAARDVTACLFGGAVLTLVHEEAPASRDLDIGIEGDVGTLDDVLGVLGSAGYDVSGTTRHYRMNPRRTCLVREVRREGWTIDLSVVESLDEIGQYTIDAIRLGLDSGEVVDRAGGLAALRHGRLVPVRAMAGENPFQLFARALVLRSKGIVSLSADSPNVELVAALRDRLVTASPDERASYQGADLAGFVAALNRAVLRSSDRQAFVGELLASRLIDAAHPELAALLDHRARSDDAGLMRVRSAADLASWFSGSDRPRAASVFSPLRQRLGHDRTAAEFLDQLCPEGPAPVERCP